MEPQKGLRKEEVLSMGTAKNGKMCDEKGSKEVS